MAAFQHGSFLVESGQCTITVPIAKGCPKSLVSKDCKSHGPYVKVKVLPPPAALAGRMADFAAPQSAFDHAVTFAE